MFKNNSKSLFYLSLSLLCYAISNFFKIFAPKTTKNILFKNQKNAVNFKYFLHFFAIVLINNCFCF